MTQDTDTYAPIPPASEPLKERILRTRTAGRPALIPFITAGFPSPDTFWEKLAELDAAGVDIIELGIPFSDPVADGPVIEAKSRASLAAGTTLQWVMDGLRERKGQYQAELVLMGYTNPFMQYGISRLATECRELGIRGIIVPDLPLEESVLFRPELDAQGVSLITLIGPNTSEERMRAYARYTRDYVYVVSVLGTTGGINAHVERIAETLRAARRAFSVPLALGFGLREPYQLDALPNDAQPDAAVIGTALLEHIESGKRIADFFAPWLQRSQARACCEQSH